MARRARSVLSRGSDLVEFRIDLLRSPDGREVRRVLGPLADSAIFTVRRADEGGCFRGSERDRLSLIAESADMDPAYLDVELRTMWANPSLAKVRLGRRTIVSWHNVDRTPGRSRLHSLAEEATALGGVPKIVPFARRGTDNLEVLSLYDMPGPSPIAFCMGQAGVFSRVMSIERGSPIIYASLEGGTTAPGQLSLEEVIALRRSFEVA